MLPQKILTSETASGDFWVAYTRFTIIFGNFQEGGSHGSPPPPPPPPPKINPLVARHSIGPKVYFPKDIEDCFSILVSELSLNYYGYAIVTWSTKLLLYYFRRNTVDAGF